MIRRITELGHSQNKPLDYKYKAMLFSSDRTYKIENDDRPKDDEIVYTEQNGIEDSATFTTTDDEEFNNTYKTCSWQHTVGIMLSEYIVLAIMSFPWSYSVLGLVPGLILTVFVSITVLYTGLIITDFSTFKKRM